MDGLVGGRQGWGHQSDANDKGAGQRMPLIWKARE